jgi:hypothetical protein
VVITRYSPWFAGDRSAEGVSGAIQDALRTASDVTTE